MRAKGSIQEGAAPFEVPDISGGQDQIKRGSALSRLAIVLFTTGLALLIVGFFAQ